MRSCNRLSRLALTLALLVVASQSTAGSPYKAESLRFFTPAAHARVEEPGLTVLVGRLADEGSVARVLGERSRKLANTANILQVSVSSAGPAVVVTRRSFGLRTPSGQRLEPLSPQQVLAAVSLPESYWDRDRQRDNFQTPNETVESQLPSERPADRDLGLGGSAGAFFALGVTGIDAAIEKAGAKRYREAARTDVLQKTELDHTLAADQTLDLLVVFVPSDGKLPPSTPLEVTVELQVDGAPWAKTVTVPVS